jgi:23S rRNA (pseudouridine1915-N3)-methyltransferase
MKLTLVCVGTPRGVLVDAIRHYERRVAQYFRFHTIEVPAGRGTPAGVRESEAERLVSRLPAERRLYALTREGRRSSSRDLADQLEELANYGPAEAVFVIGGAFGLGEHVLRTADRTLSISDLTLPHELVWLVLVEQLYRAGTILQRKPYHKGN